MKKRLAVFCILISWGLSVSSQHVFPDGVYRDRHQLRTGIPDFETDLNVNYNQMSSEFDHRLNEYLLESDSLRPGYLKRRIYAYVKDSVVYLNGRFFERYHGYAKCLTNGAFLVFNSPTKPNEDPRLMAGAMFGLIGYAIATAVIEQQPDPEHWALYVLSLRTGNVRLMTKDYLLARLEEHPSLLKQYQDEAPVRQDELLLDYVHILNHITPLE